MLKASLYFHTLRHLRPAQIIARLRPRLPIPMSGPATNAAPPGDGWIRPPGKSQSLLSATRFRFLNRERNLSFPAAWQGEGDRLWLYNLHYFDDLNALRAVERSGWHRELIAAWIRDNLPARGVGWDPYPISIRTVNWIKWALSGQRLDATALASLAAQLRLLRKRIEWHLLGNHIWANAKALVFGGHFLVGDEADEWLAFGARLLREQLEEQILDDGAHFERSPMYHAIALEDVLDLVNLLRAYPLRPFAEREYLCATLPGAAAKMLGWLACMTHPDGELAFFNDATIHIAQAPASLAAYAHDLGIASSATSCDLAASGYARLERGPWCVIFDAAPIGPDYQPGHAHADTLAFEVSGDGERLICNAGTSTYELSGQREYERSTRAHNSVEVDGKNSSEVWASFRVARRARPFGRRVEQLHGITRAECAHDGYSRLPGNPIHRRRLEVTPNSVEWIDRLEGAGTHKAKGFIPLHPGVRTTIQGSSAQLRTPRGKSLILDGKGITIFSLEEGSYAREFGLTEPRPVLVWELTGAPPLEASFTLRFGP